MSLAFIHHKLPEGAWKARCEAEFYRLLPRKRQMYEQNREFKYGLRYLIWSKFGRCYYERNISEGQDTEENFAYYTAMGYLFIWPTEENKEEIREDVKKEGLGYFRLMARRQSEIDWERKKNSRNDGDGYQFKIQYHRKMIDKLKTKYRKKS